MDFKKMSGNKGDSIKNEANDRELKMMRNIKTVREIQKKAKRH